MSAKTKFIIINLVGLAGALTFYFGLSMSHTPFFIHLFGIELAGSPGLILFISYVIGVFFGAGSVVPFLGSQQADGVAKLKEWKEQDAKLAIEVQSDKEKQLEAKIATLETALKQALGK